MSKQDKQKPAKRKTFKEWISIQIAKNPRRVVFYGILVFNFAFVIISAVIIKLLSLSGTANMGLFEAAYYTITMILDAGCIEMVIKDIGKTGLAIVIACLTIILIGGIFLTGGVIGYVTNYISNFIDNANMGTRKLDISDHTVILNWNTRASEIINDLLFSENEEKVVVLVDSRKDEIKKEIDERLADTTERENAEIRDEAKDMPYFQRRAYIRKHSLRWNVTFIVREGDVFSSKQLSDICLENAKSIVILGSDTGAEKPRNEESAERLTEPQGNSLTIKTLMQVADIASRAESLDKQKIIVEITDFWTYNIVRKIIRNKQVDGKCNIVPVFVNQILGQILSQFSLMPELNLVYKELFSNKGSSFYAVEEEKESDTEHIGRYLSSHRYAVPLTSLYDKDRSKNYLYYVSQKESDIDRAEQFDKPALSVKLKKDYWVERKDIVILGHNSDTDEIMKSLAAFICEWDYKEPDKNILSVTVIDDKENLEKMGHYRHYPFVKETIPADIYNEFKITEDIKRAITRSENNTSVLILSDDTASPDLIDARALAYLIFVQDIVKDLEQKDGMDPDSVDIIVEIIDPKHHDVVNSYNIKNVVISNRYVSKMITQIGEQDLIYNFYNDILTYDVDTSDGYKSKEIYLKRAKDFFEELPPECSAMELIRAVEEASHELYVPGKYEFPNLVLGYVPKNGKMVLFGGDQSQIRIKLEPEDKLIVYSAH